MCVLCRYLHVVFLLSRSSGSVLLVVLFPGLSIMCDSCGCNVVLICSCILICYARFQSVANSILVIRSFRAHDVALYHHAIHPVCPCFSLVFVSRLCCYCLDARRTDRLKAVVSIFDFDDFCLQEALLFHKQRAAAIMQIEECHEDHHVHHVV